MFEERIMLSSAMQFQKAPNSISVTVSGSTTLLILLQSLKASTPILVKTLEKVISVKLTHPSNAKSPILPTLLPPKTLVKDLHPRKV